MVGLESSWCGVQDARRQGLKFRVKAHRKCEGQCYTSSVDVP